MGEAALFFFFCMILFQEILIMQNISGGFSLDVNASHEPTVNFSHLWKITPYVTIGHKHNNKKDVSIYLMSH